jgi:NADH dehydrogenase
VFGPEDSLTNRFAGLAQFPILPVIAPKRRFQPIYVRDLAKAIGAAVLQPELHGGKTYEVGGPDVMTMRELVEAIAHAAGCDPNIVEMPDVAANAMSMFGFLPGAPLTRDQWLMLQRDNVVTAGADGLEAFGIEPTPLGSVAANWLGRFSGRRFHKRHVNLQTS